MKREFSDAETAFLFSILTASWLHELRRHIQPLHFCPDAKGVQYSKSDRPVSGQMKEKKLEEFLPQLCPPQISANPWKFSIASIASTAEFTARRIKSQISRKCFPKKQTLVPCRRGIWDICTLVRPSAIMARSEDRSSFNPSSLYFFFSNLRSSALVWSLSKNGVSSFFGALPNKPFVVIATAQTHQCLIFDASHECATRGGHLGSR